VGIVLDELAARGELDNTVIVYTADHGEYAGHYGRFEKKGGISHSAICRVPALWRFPDRVPAGAAVEHLAEAVDVMPTLCDLAGVETPDTVQGRSLLPLFEQSSRPIRDSALTENARRKALQTERYRYVANLPAQGERDELYDCARDPGELVNEIDNPEYAGVRLELQRRLLDRVVHAAHPITLMGGGWHDHLQDLDGRANLASQRPVTPYD
jgi:arylsulfatase A-like enzyme